MKKFFLALAVLMASQVSQAQSIYCTFLRSQDGNNFTALTEAKAFAATPGETQTLQDSEKKYTVHVQFSDSKNYSIHILKGQVPNVEILAFTLTNSQNPSALILYTDKVGASCSQAL